MARKEEGVKRIFRGPEEWMKCCRYIVAVVAAVLHERTVPASPEGISWEQIHEMAKYQGLESMVFAGVQTLLEKDGKLYQEWEKQYARNLVQCFTQEEEQKEVVRKLTGAGIEVVLLKGYLLRDLYPQKDYRQMSDLDILIKEKDRVQAGSIMRQMGYVYTPERFEESHHDGYEKPPYMRVEIHLALVPASSPYREYCDGMWERLVPEPETGCFQINMSDYYIFHLIHFAKHFFSVGYGIRAVLDSYVFLRRYREELDQDYLTKTLRELNLQDFRRTAETLGEYWFGTLEGVPGKEVLEMETNCFFSGVHGSRLQGVRIQAEKYRTERCGAIRYIFARIFMGKKGMSADYPCLKRYPVLLPFCWIHRLVKTILTGNRTILYEIKTLFRN